MPSLVKVLQKILNSAVRDITALGSFPFLLLFILIFTAKSSNPYIFNYHFEIVWLITMLSFLFVLEVICMVFKLVFFKHRPNKEDYINFIDKINSSSFPSSHMARATFVYLTLAKFVDPTRAILFYVIIILVGSSRIILKKHYFTDVIVGLAIGLVVHQFFVWWILDKFKIVL